MMIQASELREGNWFIDICGAPSKYSFEWRKHYDLIGLDNVLKKINPVIISPEILKRCRFKIGSVHSGYEYWYPNENAMWSIRQEGNGKWQFCMIVRKDEIWKFDPIIEHLHQLQNLYYSLTGQELKIKL